MLCFDKTAKFSFANVFVAAGDVMSLSMAARKTATIDK